MELKGKVKSFNAHKGWGFVECRGEDYFMHKKDLQGFCPAEGDQVQFTASYTKTGAVAKSVKVLFAHGEASFYGRIKTYNASKGFGFISSEAFPDQDVFVLWWGLPFGLGPPGSTCTFKVDTGEKGLVAKKVVLLGAAGRQIQQMQWMMGHGFKGKDKTCWDMKTKGICKRAAAGKCRWEPCNAVKPEVHYHLPASSSSLEYWETCPAEWRMKSKAVETLPATTVQMRAREAKEGKEPDKDREVLLHLYDLPGFFGLLPGVRHASLQVGAGSEWAFTSSGVEQGPQHPEMRFSETLSLGCTPLALKQAHGRLRSMESSPVWFAQEYDLLNHNCLSFAREACRQLGVDFPAWIDRLPRVLSWLG